eukprot:6292544-Pyramimonas_sp.AAC.1
MAPSLLIQRRPKRGDQCYKYPTKHVAGRRAHLKVPLLGGAAISDYSEIKLRSYLPQDVDDGVPTT